MTAMALPGEDRDRTTSAVVGLLRDLEARSWVPLCCDACGCLCWPDEVCPRCLSLGAASGGLCGLCGTAAAGPDGLCARCVGVLR